MPSIGSYPYLKNMAGHVIQGTVVEIDGCDDDGHNTGVLPMRAVPMSSDVLADTYARTEAALAGATARREPVLPFVNGTKKVA